MTTATKQKKRRARQAEKKLMDKIPPQSDTNTTEGQLMVKELKGARSFISGVNLCPLNLAGLLTLTRCLDGRHNLVARSSYCGRSVEDLNAFFFNHFELRQELFMSSGSSTHFCFFTQPDAFYLAFSVHMGWPCGCKNMRFMRIMRIFARMRMQICG